MNIKQLSVPFELKREPDADGVFEGYASVFDVVDDGLDVVAKGAFANSLANTKRKVRMLWNHNPNEVIGVWDEIKEDHRGLFVKGRLLKDVAKGRDVLALLRGGAIDSMSIGYQTLQAVKEGAARRLTEIDIWEVSLVTFPMLDAAVVTDVKSINTIREFERHLRDVGGYSNTEAKAIAAQGFKGLRSHRDVGADDDNQAEAQAFLDEIKKLTENFHG